MSDYKLAAGMIEAENREKLAAAETAKEKLQIAFAGARNHWMFTDEECQLKGGIGAAMHHMNDDDKSRVEAELRVLGAFSSAAGGVPVDFAAMEVPDDPIGVLGLWHESA